MTATVEQIADAVLRLAAAYLRAEGMSAGAITLGMGVDQIVRQVAEQVAALGVGGEVGGEVAPAELTLWAEGATPEQREVIYGAAVDAAFDASEGMGGVAVAAVGSLSDGVQPGPWVEVTDEGGQG